MLVPDVERRFVFGHPNVSKTEVQHKVCSIHSMGMTAHSVYFDVSMQIVQCNVYHVGISADLLRPLWSCME